MACPVSPHPCGTPANNGPGCATECYPDCATVPGAALTPIGVQKGQVQALPEGSSVSRQPSLAQIQKISGVQWARFLTEDGICRQPGRFSKSAAAWFFYRRPAEGIAFTPPPQQAQEETLDFVIKPFARFFDTMEAGDPERAFKELGAGWTAAAAATVVGGIALGIGILRGFARLISPKRPKPESRPKPEPRPKPAPNFAPQQEPAFAEEVPLSLTEPQIRTREQIDQTIAVEQAKVEAAEAKAAAEDAARRAAEQPFVSAEAAAALSQPPEVIVNGRPVGPDNPAVIESSREYDPARLEDSTARIPLAGQAPIPVQLWEALDHLDSNGDYRRGIELKSGVHVSMRALKVAALFAAEYNQDGRFGMTLQDGIEALIDDAIRDIRSRVTLSIAEGQSVHSEDLYGALQRLAMRSIPKVEVKNYLDAHAAYLSWEDYRPMSDEEFQRVKEARQLAAEQEKEKMKSGPRRADPNTMRVKVGSGSVELSPPPQGVQSPQASQGSQAEAMKRVEIRNDEPFSEMDFSELNTAVEPDPRGAPASKPPSGQRDRSVTQDIAEVPVPVSVVRQNTSWFSMGAETSRSVKLEPGSPSASKPAQSGGESFFVALEFMSAQEFYRNRPEFMQGIAAAFERSVNEVPGFAARYYRGGVVTQEGIEAAARNATVFDQGAFPSPVAPQPAPGGIDLQEVRADAERIVNSDPEFRELLPEVREALVEAVVFAAEHSPGFVEANAQNGRVTADTLRAARHAVGELSGRSAASAEAASRREEQRRRGESSADRPFKGK